MQATYTIPEANLSEFTSRIADLNKRARRIGVDEITFSTEHSHSMFQVRDKASGDALGYIHEDKGVPAGAHYEKTGRIKAYLTLTVTGDSPKYSGWTFVATLSPVAMDEGASENMVSVIPGSECPAEYRDRVGECDHCRTNRKRNETFVVRHESGEHKMVGRQCLRDFLGHADPHTLASWAELLASLGRMCSECESGDWAGGREPESWSLQHFLAVTSAVIRLNGWTSAGAAYENPGLTSTKSHVLYLLVPPSVAAGRSEWQKETEKHEPTEKDIERAEKAVAWSESLHDNGEELVDYLYNLSLIARAGYVTGKAAGLAASMIVAHAKADEREIERQRKAERVNEYLPEAREGDKIRAAVKVMRVIEIDGQFGVTNLHKMEDQQGRDVTWFSSSVSYDVGEVYYIEGTVKKLDEYEGRKQTVLTRVKSLEHKASELADFVAKYDAKPKLTKQQQAKRDRFDAERQEIEDGLAGFETETELATA